MHAFYPMSKPQGAHNTAVIILGGGMTVSIDRQHSGRDRTCAELGLGAHPVQCIVVIHGGEYRIAVPGATKAWNELATLRCGIAAEYGCANN